MKKYLVIFSTLAVVACNNSKVNDNANNEKQRVIDSMATVNAVKSEMKRSNVNSSNNHNSVSTANNAGTTNNENTSVKKKGMSNTTKGALIGTATGIVVGAGTGAATSEDKGKGAVFGGIIGGAVGSGIGYGIGAKKDKDQKDENK
jgi:hypothetical protein